MCHQEQEDSPPGNGMRGIGHGEPDGVGKQEGNWGEGSLGPLEAQSQVHRNQEATAGQHQKALYTVVWMSRPHDQLLTR